MTRMRIRTVWPVAGGHRHVMPPACVAATPLLPRPAVFQGISQENEALVFFSWRTTHVRRAWALYGLIAGSESKGLGGCLVTGTNF